MGSFDFRIETSALIFERGWDEARVAESRKFHRGLINRWKIKRKGMRERKKKLFQTGLRSIKSLPGFVLTVQRLKLFSPTFLGRLPDRIVIEV